MITVSLCMIVKNEEGVLARCLASVASLVDEIILVDTGSEDRTEEIAHEFTDQVLHFPWVDDFSAARNYAFNQATMDYILWLDADDLLLEEDQKAFARLKESLDPQVDMVMIPYHLAFDQEGKPTFTNYRERLVRRGAGFRWLGPVHEVIPPSGKIHYAKDLAVTHRKMGPGSPGRNLRIMETYMEKGGVLDARQRFYFARELSDNGEHQRAAEAYESYLQGEGWLENKIEACRGLAFCLSHLGREEEALLALLKSFAFDVPRAELCCDLGFHFFKTGSYPQAIYWYQRAREADFQPERGGFCLPDCYGYLPCIQLCVIYDRLGMTKEAEAFNELAGSFKPEDAAVAYNRSYFQSRA